VQRTAAGDEKFFDPPETLARSNSSLQASDDVGKDGAPQMLGGRAWGAWRLSARARSPLEGSLRAWVMQS